VTKRVLIACAAGALLVAPGAATADEPQKVDRTNAAEECRAERGTSAATREAFRVRYGTNRNGKNAFGKCVSRRSSDEQAERESAARNAAQECKAEREADGAAFAERYGTNKNAKNAFGKCVSSKAKEKEQEADEQDAEETRERRNAAKECAAERKADGEEAFAAEYGTNASKSNAFGKCVSQKASA